MLRVGHALGVCLLSLSTVACGLQPLPCAPQRQLFATYDGLRDNLAHFLDLYGDFAQSRPKVVAEHVKTFQLHALAQDFLEVLEHFRLLTCLALCPEACVTAAEGAAPAFAKVQLVERLNNLQLDVELVTDDPSFEFKATSQQFLREVKQYAATLVATALHSGGAGIDWDEGLAMCVSNVLSRLMFPLMKVISFSAKQNESYTILHGVSLDSENPASLSTSYIMPAVHCRDALLSCESDGRGIGTAGELSFGMLESLASGARNTHLGLGPSNAVQGLCSPASSPYLLDADVWPRRWRQRSAGVARTPRILEMLEHIEGGVLDLSHIYLALRPIFGEGWAQNYSCEGADVDFDPTCCLDSRGWGGYVYSVNVHPPFRAELRVIGQSLGDEAQSRDSRYMDILRPFAGQDAIDIQSVEHLFYRIDFLWRQANEPSPDVFFLHPSVHNCHAVEYLFTGAPLRPKILVIPLNPLIPPPFEVMPRFETWWHILRPALRLSHLARSWVGHIESSQEFTIAGSQESFNATAGESTRRAGGTMPSSIMDEYLMPSFWLGQCSLATIEMVLKGMGRRKFKYSLHHIDGAYAVYVREDLQKALAEHGPEKAPPRPFDQWLRGWFCSPGSRFFSKLEATAGPEMVKLADPALPKKEKEAILCRFLDHQGIPVQRRNFDCAGVIGLGYADATDPSVALRSSCERPDLRGWGNEAVVFDSVQSSAGRCESRCTLLNCSYWTFDPTAMYGQKLCWVWVGGRPAEIKEERGWISGDVDCYLEMNSARLVAESSPQAPAAQPYVLINQSSGAEVAPVTEGLLQSREFFKQWAILQPREVPGMRFFIEGEHRGRCVRGFCECFPPYRGPLCEQLDPGIHDKDRDFTAALHYLTSDSAEDVEDITHSLARLWRQFNGRFDYPVVIFNDGLSEESRERIVRASDNRVWFAYVDDYLDIPEMILDDPSRRARLEEVKWSLGYRGMCRFRSGTIFLQPVLQNFEYAMTLDTDGYFPAEVAYDPISAMHAGSHVYTWSHLLPDLPGAVRHFWDHSLMYMRMKGIDPRGTEILKQFVREEDIQWNYQLYMNDIEIVQLEWFRSEPYQDYFRYLDSMGGFWLYRWGDHAVRTIAIGMWLPQAKVYEMDIPYGHQNFCRCSGAHPYLECVREGDVGGKPANWWTCANRSTTVYNSL